MCGIFGVGVKNSTVDKALLVQAIRRLRHRGPDDSGVWLNGHVGLAHARLAIHDLSSDGRQPMLSANGRWVVVFNGEIYNFTSLRTELTQQHGVIFNSESDTEVLVNAIDTWGMSQTLLRLVGMFAFAAYDSVTKQLYLARDRFGEKPLYYGSQNGTFAFSSELKALKLLSAVGWDFDVDRDTLATYMRLSYVPAPYSIYQHIYKLKPGHYVCYADGEVGVPIPYWSARDHLSVGSFSGSYSDAVNELDRRLTATVGLQMASDVPLGAFLSGGVDSSSVVALMQAQSTDKINTFSIGSHNKEYDESAYAIDVAKHLGTNHTNYFVENSDYLGIVPRLADIYDEPFADSSQIPTLLVSQIAKQAVTVSLTGDSGDELFGGYNRYFLADKIKRHVIDRQLIRWLVSASPQMVFKVAGKWSKRYRLLHDKLIKLQRILQHGGASAQYLYLSLCSQILNPNEVVLQGQERWMLEESGLSQVDSLSFTEWMMFVDSQTYMTDDILAKVDRAAMAVSLETRVPFLDHSLYEFAWSLPLPYKIHQGVGKRVLRDVLYRYVPKALIERPKMGFCIPMDQWLRTELRDWAAALLDPSKLVQQGYLNVDAVQTLWRQHQSGRHNWQGALWTILMFQSWLG